MTSALSTEAEQARQLPSFVLGDRVIRYAVVRGTSRRYTYFRFRPDLTLEVVLPPGRRVDMTRAVRERSSWLRREYDRMSQTRRVLGSGSVMYGGVPLRLVFVEDPDTSLSPDFGAGLVTIRATEKRATKELIRRWFLKESSAYAVKKVGECAPRVGARPSRVDVREIGKWGYCTRDGRLSFSWQLVALPEPLREYVVLHELTHLLVFNHSAAFRSKLAAVCPDFRARERELDLIVPYDRLEPPD